jgi:hypothetical protein
MAWRLQTSPAEESDLRFSRFIQTNFDIQTKDWANKLCRSPEVVAYFRDNFAHHSASKTNCLDFVAYVTLLLGARDPAQQLENIHRLSREFEGWSLDERDCLGNIYVADALSRK